MTLGTTSEERGATPVAADPNLALKFYDGVVDDAGALVQAAAITGLDSELALLRVRLRSELQAHPEDFDVLLKGVRLLTQATVARYRMSPARSSEFADALASVVKQVGGQLAPERFDDV